MERHRFRVNLSNGNGSRRPDLQSLAASDVMDIRGDSSEGHYVFRLCDFQTVCQSTQLLSLDLSRDELDVTTLPCSAESRLAAKNSLPSVKPRLAFATATGTLEVYFTCDNESIQQQDPDKVHCSAPKVVRSVRLYVCTKTDAQGEIDVDSSPSTSKQTSSCSACPSPWTPTTRPLQPSTSV